MVSQEGSVEGDEGRILRVAGEARRRRGGRGGGGEGTGQGGGVHH